MALLSLILTPPYFVALLSHFECTLKKSVGLHNTHDILSSSCPYLCILHFEAFSKNLEY